MYRKILKLAKHFEKYSQSPAIADLAQRREAARKRIAIAVWDERGIINEAIEDDVRKIGGLSVTLGTSYAGDPTGQIYITIDYNKANEDAARALLKYCKDNEKRWEAMFNISISARVVHDPWK